MVTMLVNQSPGASPKSRMGSRSPPRSADSCATMPGSVNRAATHAFTGGRVPLLTAVTKSSTRKWWLPEEFLRAVHEAGVAVPGDIAVTSFDGAVEAEYSWPPLTTVEQPVAAMAEAAEAALVDARRGEEPRHRIFPTTLHVRQSCGCP